MSEFRLIPNDLPIEPEYLGESTIIVVENTTKVITVSDIMLSSFPPYFQEQGFEIGDIKIIGYGNNSGVILTNATLAALINGAGQYDYISYDPISNTYNNNEVLAQTIKDGNFKVIGTDASVSPDYVRYVAKAINPSNGKQSNYSIVEGRLWIKVVRSTNQPPSKVGDGYERFDLGIPKVFSIAMFTTKTTPQYQDPENDKPYELKILSLPNIGRLTYKGVVCKVNDIVSIPDIGLGLFRYEDLGNANLQSVVTFQFAISDDGSKQFTS